MKQENKRMNRDLIEPGENIQSGINLLGDDDTNNRNSMDIFSGTVNHSASSTTKNNSVNLLDSNIFSNGIEENKAKSSFNFIKKVKNENETIINKSHDVQNVFENLSLTNNNAPNYTSENTNNIKKKGFNFIKSKDNSKTNNNNVNILFDNTGSANKSNGLEAIFNNVENNKTNDVLDLTKSKYAY